MGLTDTARLAVRLDLEGNLQQGLKGVNRDVKSFSSTVRGSATRDLKSFSSVAKGLKANLQGAFSAPGLKSSLLQGVGLGGGLVGVQLVGAAIGETINYMGGAVSAASEMAESQSKLDAVFKTSAPNIRRWAQTANDSLLLTQQQALESAASIGNFLQAMGSTEAEAAKISTTMVKLSADLASFNNVAGGAPEVLEAIRSGLAGETEPARRLGIDISDLAVKTELLAQGVKATNGQYTQAEKIQARYALIMKQTTTAQGDVERTQDGLAVSSRQVDAALGDIQRRFGEFLLPVMTEFTLFVKNDVIGGLEDLATTAGDVVEAYQGVRESIKGATGRDIENDIANTARAVGSFGVLPIIDKVNEFGFGLEGIQHGLQDFQRSTIGVNEDLGSYVGETERAANATATLGVKTAETARAVDGGGQSLAGALQAVSEPAKAAVGTVLEFAAAQARARRQSDRLGESIELVANESFKDVRSAAQSAQQAIRSALKHDSLAALRQEADKLEKQRRKALKQQEFDAAAVIDARLAEIEVQRKQRHQVNASYRDEVKASKGQHKAAGQRKADLDRIQKKLGATRNSAIALYKAADRDVNYVINTAAASKRLAELRLQVAGVRQAITDGTFEIVDDRPGTGRGRRKDGARGATYFAGDYGYVGERGPERIRNRGGITTVTPIANGRGPSGGSMTAVVQVVLSASQVETQTSKTVRQQRFRAGAA